MPCNRNLRAAEFVQRQGPVAQRFVIGGAHGYDIEKSVLSIKKNENADRHVPGTGCFPVSSNCSAI